MQHHVARRDVPKTDADLRRGMSPPKFPVAKIATVESQRERGLCAAAERICCHPKDCFRVCNKPWFTVGPDQSSGIGRILPQFFVRLATIVIHLNGKAELFCPIRLSASDQRANSKHNKSISFKHWLRRRYCHQDMLVRRMQNQTEEQRLHPEVKNINSFHMLCQE
jgi:hypothetical protein